MEGRHSVFTAFSRLRGSRSLRESPLLPRCSGVIDTHTTHLAKCGFWGFKPVDYSSLYKHFYSLSLVVFCWKAVSQLVLWTMEVISVPIKGSILLSSVGKTYKVVCAHLQINTNWLPICRSLLSVVHRFECLLGVNNIEKLFHDVLSL